MIKLKCQFDGILNHKPLGMYVCKGISTLAWGEKAHCKQGCCHPMDWGPNLHREHKVIWAPKIWKCYEYIIVNLYCTETERDKLDFLAHSLYAECGKVSDCGIYLYW